MVSFKKSTRGHFIAIATMCMWINVKNCVWKGHTICQKVLGATSWRFQGDIVKFWKVAKTHDFVTKSWHHVFLNFYLDFYAEFSNR